MDDVPVLIVHTGKGGSRHQLERENPSIPKKHLAMPTKTLLPFHFPTGFTRHLYALY